MSSSATVDLPLRSRTPASWAALVLRDPLALLCDHAYLERKAATNALQLLNRWPEPNPPENWVVAMTSIAQDEVEHLAIVVRLLFKRGGALSRNHRNNYASALHELVRLGRGTEELIDRLMISALIEARSCERFAVLANNCADEELASLYGSLYASEAGHYRVFINLAKQLHTPTEVEARWNEMLVAEAKIIAQQSPGPTIHSGAAQTEPRP